MTRQKIGSRWCDPLREVGLLAAIVILVGCNSLGGLPSPMIVPASTQPAVGNEMMILPFHVQEAAYSKSLERLVVTSEYPHQLHIFDPLTLKDMAVDLPEAPRVLVLRPDGRQAAIAHRMQITLVDLETGEIDVVLTTAAEIVDITLASNGWVYYSRVLESSAENGIYAVDPATNEEVKQEPWEGWEASHFTMHPDGKKVYATRGSEGIFLIRLNLTGDVLTFGSYPVGEPPVYVTGYDELWFSEDGKRIFAQYPVVFRSSDNPAEDMVFNGSLGIDWEKTGGISCLAHALEAGLLLVVDGSSGLSVFDYDTLAPTGSLNLPEFVISDQHFASMGRSVYVDGTGSHFYIIVQADEESGLFHDFGLVTGRIEELNP